MFISDSLNKLINGYTQDTKTKTAENNKISLSNLKVNDEVKVSVVSVSKDSIEVRLPDGKEVSIAGNMPSNLKEGDVLNIRILNNVEGKPLVAEIISQEKNLEAKVEDLKLILKDLGISASKENLEIINEMSSNGIVVNKESINKMFNIIEGMNIPKENAIFMIKNDIEVTTESSRAFNSMINNSDFLESNLKVLIDTLSTAINEISENENINIASSDVSNVNFAKSLELNSMVKPLGENAQNNEANTPQNIQIDSSIVPQMEIENPQASINTNVQNYENVNNNANIVNMSITEIETPENTINNSVQGDLSTQIIDKTVDNSNQTSQNPVNMGAIDENIPVDSINTSTNEVSNQESMINQYSDFEFDVEEAPIVEENVLRESSEITLTKDEIIAKNPENAERVLASSDEYADENINLVKKDYTFDKALLNDPIAKKEKLIELRKEVIGIFREVKGTKELAEDISLKRIFKSFKDIIGDVENNRELFTKETQDSLLKETSRMKENLELISDLNKYNTVVHIPLQINDNKSIAELYVFNGDKNAGKRKINENNATMFLSLGTANMGQVESYIKVVNKTIECSFMTENDTGTKFIVENKDHLSDLLAAYGYTLIKASAETYTGKTLNIFEAIEKNKKDEKQKGFDALA